MSYILDALQRSDAEESPLTNVGAAHRPNPGLALPWKLAIGAVLITNLVLLYLWRTDRAPADDATSQGPVAQQGSPAAPNPPAPLAATRSQPGNTKKTLPGIASPRLAPSAANTPASTSSDRSAVAVNAPAPGTARTFKPRGAPITIASDSSPQGGTAPAPQLPATDAERPANRPVAAQVPGPESTQSSAARSASLLSQLSDGAREALYVLTFSTHIYGSDSDLRAVVVNGERLTEGNSVTADNGQEFLLLEIIDDGVIMQFEHDGATEKVQIPVMEDWKDA